MRPDVSLKQPRSGERFAAHFTNARQRVCPYVHLQGAQTHVFLLAVLAAEGFPGLRVTVQLLVFHQSGIRAVRFIAQTALKLLAVRQLGGRYPIVLVAPGALGTAVVFVGRRVGEGRGVSGYGGEVAGQG